MGNGSLNGGGSPATSWTGPRGVPRRSETERGAQTAVAPARMRGLRSASKETNGWATPKSEPPDRPPRSQVAGPLESALRHPFLTLLPMVVLLLGAILLGVQRDPEYEARSRVNVGRADVPPFYLQQVTSGNQALAASYARAIYTAPVAIRAGRETGISASDANDRLDASQVAGSTLIQVEATGPSNDSAVTLANAGARALIRYVDRVAQADESTEALRKYRAARVKLQRARDRLARVLRNSGGGSGERTRAELAVDAAQLETTNMADRYRDASVARANRSQLSLIAPAASADSDRRPTMERLIVIGLVAGLVLGLGLALLRTNWRLLRALRYQ